MDRRLVTIASLVAAVLVVTAAPAWAHFKVAKSEPAAAAVLTTAPTGVAVWFTQMPKAGTAMLTVEGPSGPVAVSRTAIGKDKSMRAALPATMTTC